MIFFFIFYTRFHEDRSKIKLNNFIFFPIMGVWDFLSQWIFILENIMKSRSLVKKILKLGLRYGDQYNSFYNLYSISILFIFEIISSGEISSSQNHFLRMRIIPLVICIDIRDYLYLELFIFDIQTVSSFQDIFFTGKILILKNSMFREISHVKTVILEYAPKWRILFSGNKNHWVHIARFQNVQQMTCKASPF